MNGQVRRICVFCGSSSGARPGYATTARELGKLLAGRNIGLVYGGGSVGLMGILADATLAAGGEVIGVIPQSLADREVAHHGLTELRIVETMHERKAVMADLADAFIAMPGGFGTLDEFFEILTWAQLGIHAKPCGLLNVERYFDSLLEFLDHTVDERLLKPAHRQFILVENDAKELLARLEKFSPTRNPVTLT
ncbi:MAG: TIGR00730 family Rossman fold protein [Burkholderiales bacterium]